ncbi:hypothetical protein [Frankia sp. Cppng1_Ct_nod]|nr:hypothetical protein [Frankia sp. Cppng1_Ct_nod]
MRLVESDSQAGRLPGARRRVAGQLGQQDVHVSEPENDVVDEFSFGT